MGEPTGDALGDALGEARLLLMGGLERRVFAATSPAGKAESGGGLADFARGRGDVGPRPLSHFVSNLLCKSSAAGMDGFRYDSGDSGPLAGESLNLEPLRRLSSDSSDEIYW